MLSFLVLFFFSSRRRHTRLQGDWSSDVCSSDLASTRSRSARRWLSPRRREPEAAGVEWTARSGTAPHRRRTRARPRGCRRPPAQNGRAAGRGRGEISGVGGSLKKKKKKKQQRKK